MPDAPATCLCGHPIDDHQDIACLDDLGRPHTDESCDLCRCDEYTPDLTIPLPLETT